MKPTLHIFVIHAEHLTLRATMIHGNIQTIRTTAMNMGYDVQVKLILKNNPQQIDKNMEDLQKQVNYEPVDIPFYNSQFIMLSSEIISNAKKHQDAWQRISKLPATDLCMVIEDDLFIIQNGMKNFEEVLRKHKDWCQNWDILFTGIADSIQDDTLIRSITNIGTRIIPAKESYFIRSDVANLLLKEWGIYKFPMRTQLSYLIEKLSLKAGYVSKPIFLDSSKLGLVPTTIHTGNVLIFNREFMELYRHYQQSSAEEILQNLPKINQLYLSIQHIESPDISFIYGLLLTKSGKHREAEKLFERAVQQTKNKQGLLNNRSEIMSQWIQIYQHLQDDIPGFLKKSSKYSDHSMALSDSAITTLSAPTAVASS